MMQKQNLKSLKRIRYYRQKKNFYNLKLNTKNILTKETTGLLLLKINLVKKNRILSQKIEENQRARKEIDAIRENLTLQLQLVEKKSEELGKTITNCMLNNLEAISGLSADSGERTTY